MKTPITGIINNVELIEIEQLDVQLIYGIVEKDYCNRWQQGDWMVSSVIVRIDTEKCLVYTLNSIYQVDSIPSLITLNSEQFSLVLQGVAPSFIKEHS